MCNLISIVLVAHVVQAQSASSLDTSSNWLVDKFMKRALMAWPLRSAEMDRTTLAKVGLEKSYRTPLTRSRSLVRSTRPERSYGVPFTHARPLLRSDAVFHRSSSQPSAFPCRPIHCPLPLASKLGRVSSQDPFARAGVPKAAPPQSDSAKGQVHEATFALG
eukprot:gnl/MRDRNA2_/MRDRNA2_149978_c0_seq1.p1 gnl/MRDRNA2_/MRDRNA2_149978_c0~~gnl/MRDRNA2_/MRDRNA2_149978_c0_seq1.p1  ORF type:complete len:162 (+),score=8.42 gnl/MRDRNA2_/MRDRNA2_149978_c0_seq1:90-575(+)